MFDYFKKRKEPLDNAEIKPHNKPKKDKIFIGILIVFSIIIIVSFAMGIGTISGKTQGENPFKFNFSITDGILLVALIVGYIILRIRKGR